MQTLSIMKALALALFLSTALQAQTPAPAPAGPPAKESGLFTRPNATPVFGEPQGRLGWEQAMERCASLKMHLPTPDEIQVAFQNGTAKAWEPKGLYWTSGDEGDVSMALAFFSNFGVFRVESKGYANHVRCVK